MARVYIVTLPETDDDREEIVGAFSTMDKAQEWVDTQFDPQAERQPEIESMLLDPKLPEAKIFVDVWHTCVELKTGQRGDQGRHSRELEFSEEAKDRELIVPTSYGAKYINVYSRKSAIDSMQRAFALRRKLLQDLTEKK